MSYRRRELRNQSAEIKTKYFIFNSKSKFLTWKYLKRWVVGRKWQFQDETKKCEKTVNDDQFEEFKQEVKMNWFECSRSLTRSRVSPRSGAVGGNGFGPKLILGWPSEGHGCSSTISFKPQNRQPKNLTPIKKEITPSDSNQNLDIPKIRITRIKDYSRSFRTITESFKSHN